ncbi:ADP-dependent glucokinase/phosphofructokinase [Acidisoma sp. 7E03]
MQNSWCEAYTSLQRRTTGYVREARWTMCGLSLCVDAFTQLEDSTLTCLADGPPQAQALAAELRQRALKGIGGELRVDWPEGPAWLNAHLPLRIALGGTAAHAARVLTLLGAPALLALEHRTPEQLAVLDPDMLLAADRPMRAAEVAPGGEDRPRVYVFEYMAGAVLGGTPLPRSSRIILRCHDFDLEQDAAFLRLSPDLLRQDGGLGAGVLAGFSSLGGGARLEAGLAQGRALAAAWAEAGIGLIHLELAGYETPAWRDQAMAGLAGSVTSIGMSLSEFRDLLPGAVSLEDGLLEIAARFRVDRIVVHADDWAIAATRSDPEREREALMMGCLLASARAAAGRLTVPDGLPAGARFADPPPESRRGDWHIVSCPSPYLRQPRTTLGLGDTFMAGCLLVLGQPKHPTVGRAPAPPSPHHPADPWESSHDTP